MGAWRDVYRDQPCRDRDELQQEFELPQTHAAGERLAGTWPTTTRHSASRAVKCPDGSREDHRDHEAADLPRWCAQSARHPRCCWPARCPSPRCQLEPRGLLAAVLRSFEDYLAAVLEREVSARNASGAELRIRAAGFGARKTLAGFDLDPPIQPSGTGCPHQPRLPHPGPHRRRLRPARHRNDHLAIAVIVQACRRPLRPVRHRRGLGHPTPLRPPGSSADLTSSSSTYADVGIVPIGSGQAGAATPTPSLWPPELSPGTLPCARWNVVSDQILPGIRWCEAWPALLAHLLPDRRRRRDPITEPATVAAGTELVTATDPATVLDWRWDPTGTSNHPPVRCRESPATPTPSRGTRNEP